MFSPVVIRASHLARPADDKEQTMNDTFGRTCGKQFATYDPDTHSWRMWPDTGLWGSIEFSETWPRTGSMRSGRVYERPTSAPRITGSASSSSSLLPTPVTQPETGNGHARNLGKEVRVLPTPIAADGDRERNNPSQAKRKSPPLSAVGHLLPTPKASDHKRGDWDSESAWKSPALVAVTAHFPTPTASDGTGGGQHPSKRVGRTKQLIDAVLVFTGEPMPPLFDVGNT